MLNTLSIKFMSELSKAESESELGTAKPQLVLSIHCTQYKVHSTKYTVHKIISSIMGEGKQARHITNHILS